MRSANPEVENFFGKVFIGDFRGISLSGCGGSEFGYQDRVIADVVVNERTIVAERVRGKGAEDVVDTLLRSLGGWCVDWVV